MIRLAERVAAAEARDLCTWLHHGASENQEHLIAAYRGMVPHDEVRRASPLVLCNCGRRADTEYHGYSVCLCCERRIRAMQEITDDL